MPKQDVTVELFFDDQWNDITGDVYARNPIIKRRGSQNESQEPFPTTISLTLDNRTGKYNPKNPLSPLFGKIGRNTPIRVSLDNGTDVRFVGEISSWTPKKSLSTKDAWVQVEAASQHRRLGQGADPLKDVLTRWYSTQSPDFWWPLDDRADSDSARSLIPGKPPLKPSGESRFQQGGTGIPVPPAGIPSMGTGSMGYLGRTYVDLTSGGELSAPIGIELATDQTLVVEITLTHPRKTINEFVGVGATWEVLTFNISNVLTPGFGLSFSIPSDPENFDPLVRFTAPGFPLQAVWYPLDGVPHTYRMELVRNGAGNIIRTLSIDGIQVANDSDPGGSLGIFQEVVLNRLDRSFDYMPVAGHLVIATSLSSFIDVDTRVMNGFKGETAAERIERLHDEEGIAVRVIGDPEDTAPMGHQYPDTFLDACRECARTDHGLFFDTRDGQGSTYIPVAVLYNQEPKLVLDFSNTELTQPLDPIIDDFGTRNDVTVHRRDGVNARAVLETGPMSVQAPPDGVGRTKSDVTLNPMSDLLLQNHAGWLLHLGTTDQIRFATVTPNLDDHPELTNDVSAVDIGDRIVIENLDSDISPDPVSLLVIGYTETIKTHSRRITFNCVPEEPYHIAELEHPDYQFIDSDSTVTADPNVGSGEFESGTDTELVVSGVWLHEVDHDILIAGVRLRVTGVLGQLSIPVRTRLEIQQTPVNGVIKTIPVGTPVHVFHGSYIGL